MRLWVSGEIKRWVDEWMVRLIDVTMALVILWNEIPLVGFTDYTEEADSRRATAETVERLKGVTYPVSTRPSNHLSILMSLYPPQTTRNILVVASAPSTPDILGHSKELETSIKGKNSHPPSLRPLKISHCLRDLALTWIKKVEICSLTWQSSCSTGHYWWAPWRQQDQPQRWRAMRQIKGASIYYTHGKIVQG